MTRNYVVVCNHWEPNRRLYYDFNEKAFYKDRFDRTNKVTFAYVIFGLIFDRILRNLFARVFMTDNWNVLFFSTVVGIFLAVLAAYLIYRFLVADPLLGEKTIKTRIFSDELDVLLKKTCKRTRLTVYALIAALGSIVLAIIMLRTTEALMSLSFIMSWAIVAVALLEFMPHRQLKFRRQLKRGEFWIDKTI